MPRVGVCSACNERTEIDEEINQPSDGSYLIHRCVNPACERYMEQQSGPVAWVETFDDEADF